MLKISVDEKKLFGALTMVVELEWNSGSVSINIF